MQNETHINDTTRATTNHVFGENIVNVDNVVDNSSKDDGMEIEMVVMSVSGCSLLVYVRKLGDLNHSMKIHLFQLIGCKLMQLLLKLLCQYQV